MHEIVGQLLDDPKAALATAAARLEASRKRGDAESQFWLHLGRAQAYSLLFQGADAEHEVAQAAAVLAAWPGARERHRLWLELRSLDAATVAEQRGGLEQRLARLTGAAQALGDETLRCRIASIAYDVHLQSVADHAAWRAAEELERCSRALGDVDGEFMGLIHMGDLAASEKIGGPSERYYERALRTLGSRPARYARGWVLENMARHLERNGEPARAQEHLERALAISRDLADDASVALNASRIAALLLQHRNDPQAALRYARQAQHAVIDGRPVERAARAQTQVLQALMTLKRPELETEIGTARALLETEMPPDMRDELARMLARAHASLGRYQQAYTMLAEASEQLDRAALDARRTEMLRLQARYDAAQRDAENAELRHRGEAARLELAARTERQRALWAALMALTLLLAGGTWFAVRALRQRRRLADLALRDELTELPNRRAVTAFAEEQFRLARRLGQSLSVALVDLDHFKLVNDTFGHVGGDRVLKAFGDAAHRTLRGQDQVGRFGGEEWLLVMPGTRAVELPAVFERMRHSFHAQPIEGLPAPHGITFSMGGAEMQAGTASLESLLADADRQLYRAKAQGRDALCR